MIFSDKLLLLVISFSLIFTLGIVAMIFMDLTDLWGHISEIKQRTDNLEILTLRNMGRIGCSI